MSFGKNYARKIAGKFGPLINLVGKKEECFWGWMVCRGVGTSENPHGFADVADGDPVGEDSSSVVAGVDDESVAGAYADGRVVVRVVVW